MGQPKPGRAVRPASGRQAGQAGGEGEAVTPVIGAVLILGITVLGIAGVLLWGAPLIDRIQAQNAQHAIIGEFEDLRTSSRELSVPDHSRFPTVVLPRGDLTLQAGSRMLVAVDFQSGCDYRVTGWSDSDNTYSTTSSSGCSGTDALYLVSGTTRVASTYNGADATSDWLWVRSHASCPTNTVIGGTVCAVAWLHSGDRISWDLGASDQERAVHLDTGAVFSDSGGSLFLEKEPLIADTVFGNTGTIPYYGLWLRSLDASDYHSISGTGSHQVYFSLIGNYVRVDQDAYRIRIDVSGDLAEAWCNAFLDRNDRLPDGTDSGTDPDSSYRSQATGCAETASGTGVRSICYSQVASSGNACTTAPTAFTVRILHARIYTSLAV